MSRYEDYMVARLREEEIRMKSPKKNKDNVVDMVNSPPHYGQGTIECIKYIEDFLSKDEFVGYLRGNIAKYLHRWRYKNGLEDLKKAEWYLSKLIQVESKK